MELACTICHGGMRADEHYIWLNNGRTHPACASAAARTRADLLSWVMDATTMRPYGRRYRGCCPFHDERGPSFFVEERDGVQRFTCYGANCGAHGDVVDFVQRRYNLKIGEAVRMLLGESPVVEQPPRRQPAPAPAPAPPLPTSAAERYHQALDADARAWWHVQGCDDTVIGRFQLGYCARCPTYFDPDDPAYRSASYTIPIYGLDGALLNIRHRIAAPRHRGDKYRPETRDRGAHLFNLPALGASPDVVITEGEKKAMVWWRFFGDWSAISATAGATNWTGHYATVWPPLLGNQETVHVIFDPGAEDAAERTAALFGRRGIPVYLPEKLDDLLLRAGTEPVLEAIALARPYRAVSVFRVPANAWATA